MPPRWSAQTLKADPPPPIPPVELRTRKKLRPAREGCPGIRAAAPCGCVPRPSQGAGTPGACRNTGHGGGEVRDPRSRAAYRTSRPTDPAEAALRGAAHWGPPPMGQPHGRRLPPFPAPPRKTRTPPVQTRPSGLGRAGQRRAGKPGSLRGAQAVGRTREGERPAPRAPRAPQPALRAPGCGVSNNTVPPGSSSETTPQPVPSHFSGLRSSPTPHSRSHPPPPAPCPLGPTSASCPRARPRDAEVGSTCDPPSCLGCASELQPSATPAGPKTGTREEEVDTRVWVGETCKPGNSLRLAAARHHRASLLLPGSQT